MSALCLLYVSLYVCSMSLALCLLYVTCAMSALCLPCLPLFKLIYLLSSSFFLCVASRRARTHAHTHTRTHAHTHTPSGAHTYTPSLSLARDGGLPHSLSCCVTHGRRADSVSHTFTCRGDSIGPLLRHSTFRTHICLLVITYVSFDPPACSAVHCTHRTYTNMNVYIYTIYIYIYIDTYFDIHRHIQGAE